MAIAPAEVQFYLSAPNAAAGFAASSVPGASLGKFMSTTQVSGVPLDNLFLDLLAPQNAAGQVDYQCVFIVNFTVTGLTMRNPFVWMPSLLYTQGGTNLAVGVDAAGAVPYSQTAPQAARIALSVNAPAGVTAWYGPSAAPYNGLLIPDIQPGYACAVWIQRTAVNSPAVAPQSLSLQVAFTSDN